MSLTALYPILFIPSIRLLLIVPPARADVPVTLPSEEIVKPLLLLRAPMITLLLLVTAE